AGSKLPMRQKPSLTLRGAEGVGQDITANRARVFSASGQTVTLSCNYSVKAENLQWYRQDPGSAPQYLLLITDTKEPRVVRATPPQPGLTAALNQERNRVDLKISSAAVSDSAVYYFAPVD
uniref:Ig-like domain-containing protein n=1 Tax=Scophthalmus maximus TaxID=52904 RepID=A0A8D3EG52_SCOMX